MKRILNSLRIEVLVIGILAASIGGMYLVSRVCCRKKDHHAQCSCSHGHRHAHKHHDLHHEHAQTDHSNSEEQSCCKE